LPHRQNQHKQNINSAWLQSMKKAFFGVILIATLGSICRADMRIVTNEAPPAAFTVDGKASGMVTDIVQALQKEVGSIAKVEILPWARAYQIAKSSPDVLIYTAGKTQDRIDLGFTFIGPVFTRQQILYRKKGAAVSVSSVEELKAKKYTLGVLHDDWRSKYFSDQGVAVDEVNDHPANVRKLMAGRIDLWVSSDIEAPANLKKENINMAEVEVAYVYMVSPSYLMLSKGTSPETIAHWSKALTRLQATDFFKSAAKKWSEQLGQQFDYAPDKGFFAK